MDEAAGKIADLYDRRPTPEYSQAFNLITKTFSGHDEPVLAVLSSAVHAVELLKRCPRKLHLAGTGAFQAGPFVSSAQGWAWGPVSPVDLVEIASLYTSILWAEPEAESAWRVSAVLRGRSNARVDLWVIASGTLRRFLPGWHADPLPAIRPLDPGQVTRLLRETGWQVQNQIAFHGPRSVVWTFLARAAVKLGRPDWGDQCTLKMRENYREPGWLWPLAPLALIHARAV